MTTRRPLAESEVDLLLTRIIASKHCDLKYYDLAIDETALFLADSLANRPQLVIQSVDITGTRITVKGLQLLVSALIPKRSLQIFTARACMLTKDAAAVLAKLIVAPGCLKQLDLRDNLLGDNGVAALCAAFNSPQSIEPSSSVYSLESLDLSANVVSDAGVLAFCRCYLVARKRVSAGGDKVALRLKSLSLNCNKLTDKAAYCLAQLLYTGNCTLQDLHLDSNLLTVQGVRALLGAGSGDEGVGVALRKPCPLQSLSVASNPLDFSILALLASFISSPPVQLQSHALLPRLDISFPAYSGGAAAKGVGGVLEAIYMSAATFDAPSTGPPHPSLHLCAKLLADALQRDGAREVSVELGGLHRHVFSACAQGWAEGDLKLYMTCLKALQSLNQASGQLGLPFVADVERWVDGGVYENFLPPPALPLPSSPKNTGANPSSVLSPADHTAPPPAPAATASQPHTNTANTNGNAHFPGALSLPMPHFERLISPAPTPHHTPHHTPSHTPNLTPNHTPSAQSRGSFFRDDKPPPRSKAARLQHVELKLLELKEREYLRTRQDHS
eukprot:gene39122-47599_t